MQQPTTHCEVVADRSCTERSNLELPLPGHHFCVGAGDAKTCIDARLSVAFDDFTTDNATCADAAVVRTLRSWVATLGESEWRSVEAQHCVFLLDAVDHFRIGVFLCRCFARCTCVGRVWFTCRGKQHFAHHDDVLATTNGIGAVEHWLQDAVRRFTSCLLG